MPSLVWDHAANCVADEMEDSIHLTREQRDRVYQFVRDNIPVYILIDFLRVINILHLTIIETMMYPPLEIEESMSMTGTPYASYFMYIIHKLREKIGESGWFEHDSSFIHRMEDYFTNAYNDERRLPMTNETRIQLYRTLNELITTDVNSEISVDEVPIRPATTRLDDDADDANDDVESVASDDTAATIVIERQHPVIRFTFRRGEY